MNLFTLNIQKILITIVLGIIEGITEFFPISSTSHIILCSKIFKIAQNESNILNTFMQFGTSLSIFLYFKSTFVKMLFSIINIKQKNIINDKFSQYHVFFGILPASIIGLCFHKYIKILFSYKNICLSLIFGSALLTASEIFKRTTKYKNKNINIFKSFIIGLFQCLAVLPGFSRSCSTISIGILIGLNQRIASQFSFIISIPIFFGETIFDVINSYQTITLHNTPIFLIGFFSAFLTSKICVKKFFKIIETCSFIPFIIYRLALSLMIYLFLCYF
ncbi:MAG: undecaprenyl-diphosphate phosphatase [Buchnera aphidicola (Nurudea ibofushi)]